MILFEFLLLLFSFSLASNSLSNFLALLLNTNGLANNNHGMVIIKISSKIT